MGETPNIVVDLQEHCVWSDGERVALQRKTFELLAFFIRNPGRLLTKEAILRGVWPDTYVTEGSVKDGVKQLRSVLGDDPSSPRYIATERGLGYRYLGGISVVNGQEIPLPDGESSYAVASEAPYLRRVGHRWALIALVLVAGVVGALLLRDRARDFAPASEANMPFGLPVAPSIAVMPFQALGDDRTLDLIASGVADDMTTSLARLPQVFVSARGTTTDEALQDLPPNEIAEKLGVRYLLQGSVQGAPDQTRISARLVDTQSGRIVMTRQFDLEGADLFDARDEIILETLAHLSVTLDQGQRDRDTRDTVNLKSWLASNEAYLEYLKFQPEANARARKLWQQALALDDTRAVPHAGIAFTHFQDAWRGWTTQREDSLQQGFEHAEIALRRDPDQPLGYQALGSLLVARGQVEEGIAAKRKAVDLAPNDFAAIGGLASFLPAYGFEVEAVSLFNRAVRLNPDPPAWVPLWFGHALHVNGQIDNAVEWLQKAVVANPEAAHVHARLAVALTDQGRVHAAHAASAKALELDPDLTTGMLARLFPFERKETAGWFNDLMKKAGLPD